MSKHNHELPTKTSQLRNCHFMPLNIIGLLEHLLTLNCTCNY